MSISPRSVRFDADTMWVGLDDGRTLGVPLAWFPRLLRASEDERKAVELSPGRRGVPSPAPVIPRSCLAAPAQGRSWGCRPRPAR